MNAEAIIVAIQFMLAKPITKRDQWLYIATQLEALAVHCVRTQQSGKAIYYRTLATDIKGRMQHA